MLVWQLLSQFAVTKWMSTSNPILLSHITYRELFASSWDKFKPYPEWVLKAAHVINSLSDLEGPKPHPTFLLPFPKLGLFLTALWFTCLATPIPDSYFCYWLYSFLFHVSVSFSEIILLCSDYLISSGALTTNVALPFIALALRVSKNHSISITLRLRDCQPW